MIFIVSYCYRRYYWFVKDIRYEAKVTRLMIFSRVVIKISIVGVGIDKKIMIVRQIIDVGMNCCFLFTVVI